MSTTSITSAAARIASRRSWRWISRPREHRCEERSPSAPTRRALFARETRGWRSGSWPVRSRAPLASRPSSNPSPMTSRPLHSESPSNGPARAAVASRVAWMRNGGPEGNERLTATTGGVLLLLLAAEGVTILFIRPLLSLHMFLGVLLIPPVALKLASSGYRLFRYYAGSPPYRLKGPPQIVMRLLAPFLVAATAVVFASGVVLLATGRR